MMSEFLIKGANIVNEGKIVEADLRIKAGRIDRINENGISPKNNEKVISAEGLFLIPGMIDDQVHFREPGLTHKAEIYTEAKAAVAGGITTYMEMPNTIPNTLTQELLEEKYQLGRMKSLANYSFYMGASNSNSEEVAQTNPKEVCGVKIFMGASTGNMLVDQEESLEQIFKNAPCLIATHCEDEATIRKNLAEAKKQYGEDIPMEMHPVIRNEEACYLSSSKAINLAKKHNSRLHILHLSTAKEMELFTNQIPLENKKITAEACIHHLWFTDEDYADKGSFIKWNPAIKGASDREAIRNGVKTNLIDVIATDHAPHTLAEKKNSYLQAPSGGPLVQHALPALLDLVHQGVFSLEQMVEKTAHAVADCFQINQRGYIREGYYADLVLIDLHAPFKVGRENILSKCAWSPFEGHQFSASIKKTFVSGHLAYDEGVFNESQKGQRLTFDR